GCSDDAQRDVESATLATRERAHPRSGHRGQADEFEDLPRVARGAVAAGEHLHDLAHREHSGVADLLQHDPDAGAPVAAGTPGILAEHADLPGVPLTVALEDLDGGGLAGAVGPEYREDLAVADIE